jgi:hypothetical protein
LSNDENSGLEPLGFEFSWFIKKLGGMKKMGYTHYFSRKVREIEREKFSAIVADFKKLLPLFKVLDVQLASGNGTGEPVLGDEEVVFNGNTHCGHPQNKNVVIPWPSDNPKFGVAKSGEQALCDTWFAGVVLNQRMCNGDCSYETFYFPRRIPQRSTERNGYYFDCCKTAFRPYDLAVQVFLIIAKHHLGKAIVVESDGNARQWLDAVKLCENVLDYGSDFELGEQGSLEKMSNQELAATPKEEAVFDQRTSAWATRTVIAKRKGDQE